MPNYRFTTIQHPGPYRDEACLELPDDGRATKEARRSLVELAADLEGGWARRVTEINVYDNAGNMIFRASMALDDRFAAADS